MGTRKPRELVTDADDELFDGFSDYFTAKEANGTPRDYHPGIVTTDWEEKLPPVDPNNLKDHIYEISIEDPKAGLIIPIYFYTSQLFEKEAKSLLSF